MKAKQNHLNTSAILHTMSPVLDEPRPEHMVDAMVKDTGAHLATIEAKRSSLETSLAEGKPDEEILVSTQGLVQSVKDYKAAATHVKKVSSKPKAKKAEAKEPDQQPGA
jgi:hypothetical protein